MRSLTFSFDVPPVPASRPRVTRFATFYTKTYTEWRKRAAAFVPAVEPFDGPLEVIITAICKRPQALKKGAKGIPVGDCDNLAKGPMDTCTKGGVWHDDKQVVRLLVEKRYAEPGELARTEITINQLET